MTKEELAAKLNGREYPFEMSIAEITEAKETGLVIDMNEVKNILTGKE